MNAAQILVALQEADLNILRAKKRLDEMPERENILKVHAKLAEIEVKAQQVYELRAKCDADISRLTDEDSLLKERVDELQGKIKETTDYRAISSLTRDLEGNVKRREKIEFEMTSVLERSEKIAALEKQVDDARSSLASKEEKLIASFKANGAKLQTASILAARDRERLSAQLPDGLLARYEKCCKAHGGIGIGVLRERRCSSCRNEFHEGHLAKFAGGPDLTECPSCHRILIVRGLDEED